jgi:hypothetical protein
VLADLSRKNWTRKIRILVGFSVTTNKGWDHERKTYSQEQKVFALKQVEAGSQAVEVCRQHGMSVATSC